MNEASKTVIERSQKGLCPICKKNILACAVIDYQDFNGVQVGICGEHPKP